MAKNQNHKTITSADVIKALEIAELDALLPTLKDRLKGMRDSQSPRGRRAQFVFFYCIDYQQTMNEKKQRKKAEKADAQAGSKRGLDEDKDEDTTGRKKAKEDAEDDDDDEPIDADDANDNDKGEPMEE